ncbi:hypothetical protein BDZ89DRAFT_1167593 [Hymenopellis radicata]|nr:hypothetical protein BDZ89DRAFT_1167593 [Hymenopellis radicata]
MITKPFQDEYTRLLYSKARGYPPLDPETLQPHPSPTWPLEGAQIGDLVLLDLSGALLYVGINVTKGADDPRNWQHLPKDYKPCPLELGIDYTINPSQFPSPTIIGATTGPTNEFEVHPMAPTEDGGRERVKFSTHASNGAFCALPLGGSSQDCTLSGLAKLRRLAMTHGATWYYHVMNLDSLELQNGNLTLITGCEKTSYFVLGLFETKIQNPCFTKTLTVPKVVGDVAERIKMVEDCPSESTPLSFDPYFQSGRPDTASRLNNQPSCVALRGFHISLKASIYNDMRDPRGIRQSIWHALPSFLRPPTRSWPVFDEAKPTYQPCAAINNLIHSSNRRVKTAVVHDKEILSILRKDELPLPSDAELARRMITRYVISVDKAGGAFLQDKSDVKLSRWAKLRLLNWRGFLSVRQEDSVLE